MAFLCERYNRKRGPSAPLLEELLKRGFKVLDRDVYYIEGKETSWDETMKYMDKDEFKEKVPYWYDYESILTTK